MRRVTGRRGRGPLRRSTARAPAAAGTLALRYPGGIGDLCYLPDGRGAVAVGGTVEIWDLAEGRLERTDSITPAGIRSIEPSADGSVLLVADSSGAVHLWNMRGREIVQTIETGQSGLLVAHYSPDETRSRPAR